jgi:ABC-2 type transport system permease protein
MRTAPVSDLTRALARTLAFASKELVDIIRQPRLLVMLILGPFVILALFGAGYRQQSEPLRTVFVVGSDTEFAAQLEEQADDVAEDMTLVASVETRAEAIRLLRDNTADVAVVVPDRPVETIRDGEQAVFVVLHDQLDPFEQATITLVARTSADVVNQRILAALIASGQQESEDLETLLPAARDSAATLRIALRAGNTNEAIERRSALARQLGLIQQQTGSTEILIDNIEGQFAVGAGDSGVTDRLTGLSDSVDDVDVAAAGEPLDEEIAEVEQIEADLAELSENLADFRAVPPNILVSPFTADSELVTPVDIDITAYYAPGVIALLIQHIAITFAGLSLVRERSIGTTELFGVAPVGSAQILVGKYLGYVIAIGAVGASLSALMFAAFGVPLAGSVWDFVALLVLLSLASLGVGFVISSIVDSDTQAVNLSLIVLLLSIFFSGFFLTLDRILPAVRIVSWALPITHAIDSLRDVMFRAEPIDTRTLVALGGGTVGLFVVSWMMLRRRLRST